mmetsp:Transcript_5292/g.24398  ORF Transcript_5292/g.24398 Transcript_5292/m.24398 type:complete len:254 (+) Transcript_5292:2065-2826(+)
MTRSRSLLASDVFRHSASRCLLRLFTPSSSGGPGSLHGTEKKRRVASRIPSKVYVTDLTTSSPVAGSTVRSTASGGRFSGWKNTPATSLSSSTSTWWHLDSTCTSGGTAGYAAAKVSLTTYPLDSSYPDPSSPLTLTCTCHGPSAFPSGLAESSHCRPSSWDWPSSSRTTYGAGVGSEIESTPLGRPSGRRRRVDISSQRSASARGAATGSSSTAFARFSSTGSAPMCCGKVGKRKGGSGSGADAGVGEVPGT